MNRPETRPLLPQTTPMSTFAFAPPNMGLGDTKKNYVFVDEHNRHKRLKVMRACEGCRRRKIKCDAATTNSWPCAACVRLKLTCVPPTVNYNRAQMGIPQTSGLERVLDFATDSGDSSGDEGFMTQPMPRNIYHSPEVMAAQQVYPTGMLPFNGSIHGSIHGSVHGSPYQEKADPIPLRFDSVTSVPNVTTSQSFHSLPAYPSQLPSSHSVHIVDTSTESWQHEHIINSHLTDILGELKIDTNALAPYIVQQKKTLAEVPAFEEVEFALPPSSTGSGMPVRIPPELMPDESQAMEYFHIFFTDIHPYVPVISKSYFYNQWRNNRQLISPLLLEAIFACAGRTSSDPAQGSQWLALATKHETCFMDVPRLSTLQALLILLKAREANAKRGYYYRSWMTLQTIFSMAKDLELHEHHSAHQAGRSCTDSRECLVKSRIWQTIFIGEVMIGGPQGRYDLGVEMDSVDFATPSAAPDVEEEEYQVSRNFVYFARDIRNARSAVDVYRQIKKEKNWQTHPLLTSLNPTFPRWLEELPADMQIHYPPDGSSPYLSSHYVGNLHCYYHLSILMLHRPQLAAADFSVDSSWKKHMSTCYQSAKYLCRIQEALYNTWHIEGFLYMQRGVNFAIYCILTCVMIHLAAITSPDPDFNSEAKDYFTRHMRLLEYCSPAWPAEDLQAQILSLRQAFSADINRPFELKPGFPYGSPPPQLSHTPPPAEIPYERPSITSHPSQDQISYHSTPITPPISAGHDESKDGPMAGPTLTMMGAGRSASTPVGQMGDDAGNQWNPNRIFDQWHTAFGTPSPTTISVPAASIPQPPYSPSASTVSHDLSQVPDSLQQQQFSVTSNMTPTAQIKNLPNTCPTPTSNPHAYVTPSMWQDTVANTYVSQGLKRRWDGTGGPAWMSPHDQQQLVHI